MQLHSQKILNSPLFRGFVATLLGSGFSKIILVLATFVCSNMLGKQEFGELSFVRNTLNMFLCICALNFTTLCTKFTTEARTTDKSLHRLLLLFLFSLMACLTIGLSLIIFPDTVLYNIFGTEKVFFFLKIVGVLLPLFMLQPLIEGVLRGLKKFTAISILQTCSSLFYLIVVYVGIKINGLDGAMIGVLLYYVLYSVASFFILYYGTSMSNHINRLRGFWNERSTVYSMILPIFLMSFIDAPAMWIAQVILSKSGTMGAIGSMTAMMQIRNLAMLIPGYFTNTYIAFAGELNSQKKYGDYYRQFVKIEKFYIVIGLFMFVVLSFFSESVLFLYGKDFVSDWKVMIISNIGIPLTMMIGLYRMDLMLKDHQQFLFYTSLVWNSIWLILLLLMTYYDVNPLASFFISQNLAAIVFVFALYYVYKKDKKELIYEE